MILIKLGDGDGRYEVDNTDELGAWLADKGCTSDARVTGPGELSRWRRDGGVLTIYNTRSVYVTGRDPGRQWMIDLLDSHAVVATPV